MICLDVEEACRGDGVVDNQGLFEDERMIVPVNMQGPLPDTLGNPPRVPSRLETFMRLHFLIMASVCFFHASLSSCSVFSTCI